MLALKVYAGTRNLSTETAVVDGSGIRAGLERWGVILADRAEKPFAWADVIAGDIGAIRRYAPTSLKRKTIVVENASPEDAADLRDRGVSILVTLMLSTDGEKSLGRWSAAVIEAMLAALRKDPNAPLNVSFIHQHKAFRWTRYLPDRLVETAAAYM